MPSLLLIDDEPSSKSFINQALKGENIHVSSVGTAEDAYRELDRDIPDLILLDLTLPDDHGFDVLRAIRIEPRFDTLPIIIYSASDDLDTRVKSLDLGAAEYITKPVAAADLAARIRALLRLKLKHDQMIEEYRRLSELSLTDPLTSAYNRRALDSLLKSRLAESVRHGTPVSCVMCDLDHFKEVNDTYGHDTGDIVLREVSELIRALFRQEDALIRYGGEEFLVILLHTGKEGARIFSERVRERVSAHVFKPESSRIHITLSAGLACHPVDPDTAEPDKIIRLADQRLYIAKRNGRDQVVWEG